MVRPDREPLTGEVEADETFVGGGEKGGGRRHLGNKAMVGIVAAIRGKGIGRIRLSLQSTHLAAPREALLPPGPASGCRQSRSLRCHHQARSRPAGPKTQAVGGTQVKVIPLCYHHPAEELFHIPLITIPLALLITIDRCAHTRLSLVVLCRIWPVHL